MGRRLATQLVIVFGLGCGSGDAQDDTTRPTAPTASTQQPANEPATTPPEVELTWLPGGVLALENSSQATVSLARELSMLQPQATEPTPLGLGLECAIAPRGADACITLVPGAALALGRWPNDHGGCRCPPCVDAQPDASFVIHTCGNRHELTLGLPARLE